MNFGKRRGKESLGLSLIKKLRTLSIVKLKSKLNGMKMVHLTPAQTV